MKKITIILAIILISFSKIFAQFYNKGGQVIVQNGGVLMVEGDFLNDVNSEFKNESKVIIKGNITNNVAMPTQTAGLWEFSGSTNQKFLGNFPLHVFDVKFDNGAGFLLNNRLKIYNEATFANGLVNSTDANMLIFGENGFIANSPHDGSHVVGPVGKDGTTSFTFPIGDGAKYQPIKADFTQNTNGFSAKYLAGNAGTGNFSTAGAEATALSGFNSNEYWQLQPMDGGTTSAQITLYWDNFRDAFPNPLAERKVAHKVGTDWLNEGSTTTEGNTTTGSVHSALISNWSPIALGFVTTTPLPVRLISFSAKKIEKGNQLKWLTSNEINASHFEIEKSDNGKTFNKIGEVKANGGPAEKAEYEYVDYATNYDAGSFYRLKMVDLDGKFDYSKVLFIKSEDTNSNLKLYPNPALSVLTVENNDENVLEIINLSGQKQDLNILDRSGSRSRIDVSKLPKGIYLLKTGNGVGKFLKQ